MFFSFSNRYWISGVLGAGWLAVSGCGDENTSLGGGGATSGACESKNWRQASPGSVVCPGAPNCECDSGQVCCVEVVNNKASNGACGALADCKGPALTCDGSEDCPSGQICCLVDAVGGGSSCRDPNDCFFTGEAKLCRDDANCDGIDHCTPAQAGSYLDGLVAGCLP